MFGKFKNVREKNKEVKYCVGAYWTNKSLKTDIWLEYNYTFIYLKLQLCSIVYCRYYTTTALHIYNSCKY